MWDSGSWVNGGCLTNMNITSGTVTCTCPSSVGVYIGAFKAAVEYAIEVESQLATTTMTPETTSTISGASGNSESSTTTTTAEPVITVPAKFSFVGDYNDTINKLGGKANARDAICTDVRYTLQLKTSEFKNCDISSGSVVVTFDIVQTATEAAETQDLLVETVRNDAFTVTTPDGTALQTQTDSTVVNGEEYGGGDDEKKEEDDKKNMKIIIIAAAAAGALILIIIIVVVICKCKKDPQVHDSEEVGRYFPI